RPEVGEGRPTVARADGRSCGARSRRQALDRPGACGPRVEEAVVETPLAHLPELDAVGRHAIAAPEVRTGRILVGKRSEDPALALDQRLAALDHLALWRSDRADPAVPGAACKVAIGIRGRDASGDAFDADLAMERRPPHRECGPGTRLQLTALAALVVGEEHEAVGTEVLEQDDAYRGLARGVGGRERHRGRLHQV